MIRPRQFTICLCLLATLLATPLTVMAWSLQDSTGKTLSQDSYSGQWVLVNFWATWCNDCMKEIPELVRVEHDKAKAVAIIGVAVQYRDPQKVLNFARKKGMDYPIVLGNEDTAAEFGGIRGLPESFLYAPGGKLVRHFHGPQTEASIEQAMQQSPR